MFINVMQKFKLERKIAFITFDGARNAKIQVKIASDEKNVIMYVYEDESDSFRSK